MSSWHVAARLFRIGKQLQASSSVTLSRDAEEPEPTLVRARRHCRKIAFVGARLVRISARNYSVSISVEGVDEQSYVRSIRTDKAPPCHTCAICYILQARGRCIDIKSSRPYGAPLVIVVGHGHLASADGRAGGQAMTIACRAAALSHPRQATARIRHEDRSDS